MNAAIQGVCLNSKIIKQKQHRLLALLVIVGLVLVLGLSLLIKKEKPKKMVSKPYHRLVFSSPLQAVDTTTLWREKIQKALQATQARQAKVEALLLKVGRKDKLDFIMNYL